MKRLLACLALEGQRLSDAALAIGGSINFDPLLALQRDLAAGPGEPGLISANRHCHLVQAQDGWMAINLARPEDQDALSALFECDARPIEIAQLSHYFRQRPQQAWRAQAQLLHLPLAALSEAQPVMPSLAVHGTAARRGRLSVVDLSALWAGPYCAALLAEAGADVVKVDSPRRPDPTAIATPLLNSRLNGRKRIVEAEPDDRAVQAMIARADVLITSGRPHALARLGLTQADVFAVNPTLLWVAITAHGWNGEAGLRVGFGDDCAVAGGLVEWHGAAPCFLGDALADPLTGLAAARCALQALNDGHAGMIDASLAQVAAWFAVEAGYRP